MKKSKIIMGLTAALLLASCGGNNPSSSSHPTGLSSDGDVSTSHPTGLSSEGEGETSHSTGLSSEGQGDASHPTGLSSEDQGGDASYDSEGSGESGGSTEAPVVKTDWTDEEKQLMRDHLYGVVLPFIDLKGGVTVTYDETADEIILEGGKLGEGKLDAIAAIFENDEDWDGGDYSEAQGAEEGSFYSFETEVLIDNSYFRYVNVDIYGLDEEHEFDSYGSFVLEAYDPYVYEFPAEFAADLVAGYGSEVAFPWFDSDYSSLFHYIVSEKYGAFVAYFTWEEDVALSQYNSILEQAEFTILPEKDKDGFYVAVSPDEMYDVDYMFDAAGGALIVYITPHVFDAFPHAKMAEFLADYPTLPIVDYVEEGVTYSWSIEIDEKTSEETGVILMYGAADYETYLGNLAEAGYIVNLMDDPLFISLFGYMPFSATYILEEGIFTIDGQIYPEQGIAISFGNTLDPLPSTEWPEEKINAYLATFVKAESIDELPVAEIEGFVGYEYDETYGEIGVMFKSAEEAEAAVASYVVILTEAGFIAGEPNADEDVPYISPNDQYQVYVEAYNNYVYISMSYIPSNEWPTDAIAEMLAEKFGDGENPVDELPSMDTSDAYDVYIDSYDQIHVSYDGAEGAGEAAQEAYAAILLGANFTEGGVDEYGDTWYISPNGQYQLCPWVSKNSGDLVISFSALPTNEWPTEEIASLLDLLFDATDVLPVIDTTDASNVFIDEYDQLEIVYEGIDSVALAGIQADYIAVLLDAGFTEGSVDGYGDMWYISPNGQYQVCPWLASSRLVISFEELPTTEWPNEGIAALLDYWFGEDEDPADVLPALVAEGIVDIDIDEEYIEVGVIFESEDDAIAAQAAYISILEDAGFIFFENDGYDDWYASPNADYLVCAYVEDNAVYISFNMVG